MVNQETIETYIKKLYDIGHIRNNIELDKEIKITYCYLNPDRAIFKIEEIKNNYYYMASLEFSPSNEEKPFLYFHPE